MDRLLPEPLRYLTATPAGFVKLGAGEADLFEDGTHKARGHFSAVSWYFRYQPQSPMPENGVVTALKFSEIEPAQDPR